ncbi:MAG: alpha-1,2-fucosyltransferase [Anaerolineae bacterium]|nr:alpha-1,2-fucosyltransferase [Anaerolineae bacterium]
MCDHKCRGFVTEPLCILFLITVHARASVFIGERVPDAQFFVFSDDPIWVQENLRLDFPMTCVSLNNADTAHEDLRLMSACQHHIIANSSFSWWGAWLNPNPKKVVVAPIKWANDPALNYPERLPSSWHRM